MYNDPNQPQQPYGQPQPPYGQPPQQPYGQPPQYPPSYGQPLYGAPPVYTPPPQPRRSRRLLWIILAVVGVLVLACVGGVFIFVNAVTHSPATNTVNQYYTAMESQDYATAYQYLDPGISLTFQGASQQISQTLFTTAAQAYDAQKGKITSYSITSTNLNSSTSAGNTAAITVNVTRNGSSYDVHLQLKQEGSDWKIVSFDSL